MTQYSKIFPLVVCVDQVGFIHRPVCRTTALAWMKLCGVDFKKRLRGTNCIEPGGVRPSCSLNFVNPGSHAFVFTLTTHVKIQSHSYYLQSLIRWLCISNEKKLALEAEGEWVEDELATRIPVEDVGEFPPGVGVAEYIHAKSFTSSTENWYVGRNSYVYFTRLLNKCKQIQLHRWEYHVDHLPDGWRAKIRNGGHPSQRKRIVLPCAAPVDDVDVLQRLRNLFLTSVPQLSRWLLARVNDTCKVNC